MLENYKDCLKKNELWGERMVTLLDIFRAIN